MRTGTGPACLCWPCAKCDRTSAPSQESGSSKAGRPGTEASSTHTHGVALVSCCSEPQFPYLYLEDGHPRTHKHQSKYGKHVLGVEALLEQHQLLLGVGQSWGASWDTLPATPQICGLLYCMLLFTSQSTCATSLSVPYPGRPCGAQHTDGHPAGAHSGLAEVFCRNGSPPHPRPPQQTL